VWYYEFPDARHSIVVNRRRARALQHAIEFLREVLRANSVRWQDLLEHQDGWLVQLLAHLRALDLATVHRDVAMFDGHDVVKVEAGHVCLAEPAHLAETCASDTEAAHFLERGHRHCLQLMERGHGVVLVSVERGHSVQCLGISARDGRATQNLPQAINRVLCQTLPAHCLRLDIVEVHLLAVHA